MCFSVRARARPVLLIVIDGNRQHGAAIVLGLFSFSST
jgi:hypothetical protein